MTLHRHDLPILEYDSDPAAILEPNRNEHYRFPEKCVFPFLLDETDRFAEAHGCEPIGVFVTITKTYPIYRIPYGGHDVCFCQAPLGAAAAVQMLDFLIACGVRQVISAGSCGTLTDRPENGFLIPTAALRDEGTSYHYLPPARAVQLNPAGIQAIAAALDAAGQPFEYCKTWTTDGFFRETRSMTAYRRSEGCSVVEMECAALAACAEFRQIIFGQLLFCADSLADPDAHDDRNWGLASLSPALRLCFEAIIRL